MKTSDFLAKIEEIRMIVNAPKVHKDKRMKTLIDDASVDHLDVIEDFLSIDYMQEYDALPYPSVGCLLFIARIIKSHPKDENAREAFRYCAFTVKDEVANAHLKATLELAES